MTKLMKTAILVMAMVFSASMAFGQNTGNDNNSGFAAENWTSLTLKVELSTSTACNTNVVKATIAWYNDGVLISYWDAIQTAGGTWVTGTNKWEFPTFSVPTSCLQPGDSYVVYTITALNDLNSNPPKFINQVSGTFTVYPKPYENELIITPNMWPLIQCPHSTE
jgi:hypothetical protein